MKNVAFYVANWTTGGVENVVKNLLLSNDLYEYKKFLLIGKIVDDYCLNELKKNGIVVIEFQSKSQNKIYRYINDISYIKKIIKLEKIDLIHINTNNCYGLLFSFVLHNKAKIVLHSHNSGFGGLSKIKKIFTKVIQKLFSSTADYYLGCSQKAIDFAFGTNTSIPSKVLNNGINCRNYLFSDEKREILRKQNGFKSNDKVIGHVGHFNFQKNQTFLIDLLVQLVKKSQDYKLLMIGDGETKESLISYAKEKNVYSNCVFLSARDSVGDYYSAMDYFVFPSIFEGFGIVTIEAQVSGLITIVSDVLPESVMITPSIEKISIEDKMQWVNAIEEKSVPYKRKDYSSKIIDAGFDVSSMGKTVKQVYQYILENYDE